MPRPVTDPLPIIEPKQSVPPCDEGSRLFTKVWWLFFNQLARRVSVASGGFYSIVFAKGGSLITDELVPSFIVLANREGIPLRGCFRARVAPAANALLNMTITEPGGLPVTLFAADVAIPAGSTDPVFSSDLAIAPEMTEGYIVDLVVVYEGSSGGLDAAAIFTAELTVQRT